MGGSLLDLFHDEKIVSRNGIIQSQEAMNYKRDSSKIK